MEVPLVIVNAVILLVSLAVIRGNDDVIISAKNVKDRFRNTFRTPSMDQMEFRTPMNHDIQAQYNWANQNMPMDGTIDSLMRSNKQVINKLDILSTKIDRILDNDQYYERNVIDKLETILEYVKGSDKDVVGVNSSYKTGRTQNLIKEFLSALRSANKNLQNIGEVMANSKQSLESLKKVAEIVQDIDARIRADTPYARMHDRTANCESGAGGIHPIDSVSMSLPIRTGGVSSHQSQDNEQNYNVDKNELNSRIDKIFKTFDSTEKKSHKTIDGNNPNPTTDKTTEVNHKIFTAKKAKPLQNGDMWKRTYQSMKSITSRVTYEPEYSNCHDLQDLHDGIYKFGNRNELANEGGRFFYERYCEFDVDGPAWTVIQRRYANRNQISFNRPWSDYKLGFGNLDKEFWFGNDFIHNLTSQHDMELRIILVDEKDKEKQDIAEYSLFKMKSEAENYKLVVEGYNGSMDDIIKYLNDQEFSTYDRRNGKNNSAPCSPIGNGEELKNCTEHSLEKWLQSKSTKMMVRPKRTLVYDGSMYSEKNKISTFQLQEK